MKPRPRHALLVGWLAAIALHPLNAQSTPAGDSAGGPSEAAIVLSPFEISATQDSGYVGQETLSGSRVRTNLKDLAAAISPMTAEFLNDIAATSVGEAVEYGLAARVQTPDASIVGAEYNDGYPTFRIRGLPGASRTVNFFPTGNEVDLYMIEQLEFSRGPNSILFGFGSAAGRINSSTKQARLNKNSYSFSARFDNWGGQRYTADANYVLIKNKLAFRIALLAGRDSSWRSYGHNDQDRIFFTTKWQVDPKTTVRFDFERGNADRFSPRRNFGFDFHSRWEANGMPIWDNFSSTYVPGTFPGSPGSPGSPNQLPAGSPLNSALATRASRTSNFVVVSRDYQYAQNFAGFMTSNYDIFNNNPIMDFEMGRKNPEAVLEANWVGGKYRNAFGTLTVQREFLPGLNAELALNRTTSYQDIKNLNTYFYYGLAIDPNRYQPNGLLKPADHLYYFDGSPYRRILTSRRNEGRLTLSYEKKLRDLATLRLGFLGEMSGEKFPRSYKQQYWLNGPDDNSGGALNPTPENATNIAFQRFYFPDASVFFDPNFRVPGPDDLSGPTQYQDPKTGTIRNIYARWINRNQINNNQSENFNSAQMAVAQLYLLKNRLVLTTGYRQDRTKTWLGVAIRDPLGEAVAPGRGAWITTDPRADNVVPVTGTGSTKTVGGVVHLTSWLSGFYNTSSSASVQPAGYVYGDPTVDTLPLAPQPHGVTDDYGLKLNLFGERLFVTATKYHTVSDDETGFSGFGSRDSVRNIWLALKDSGLLSGAELATATKHYDNAFNQPSYVQDAESRGYELEVVGRPLPGWSISLNYSKIDAARSNIAREFLNYVDHWKPYWLQYRNLAVPQSTTQPRPQYATGFTDFRAPADILTTGDFTINTDSINETIVDMETSFFDSLTVFELQRSIGDARHNVNLRTRYDFREGILKGLSAGVGVRFRLDRSAGMRPEWTLPDSADAYVERANGRSVSSITEVTVPDQKVYDAQISYSRLLRKSKLRWSVQLNIDNLTDQRELITNYVNPRTLQPIGYYYQDPRRFILTNTFSF